VRKNAEARQSFGESARDARKLVFASLGNDHCCSPIDKNNRTKRQVYNCRAFHIQGGNMRKTIAVVVFLVAVLSASLGFAQNPNYDVGAVWRVTHMHLKPGMGDCFLERLPTKHKASA
jgi:hypothetical protein